MLVITVVTERLIINSISTLNSKLEEYIGAITKRAMKPRTLFANPLFNRSRVYTLPRKQHDIYKI